MSLFSYSLGPPLVGSHPRTRPGKLQGEASNKFQTWSPFTLATGNGCGSWPKWPFPFALEMLLRGLGSARGESLTALFHSLLAGWSLALCLFTHSTQAGPYTYVTVIKLVACPQGSNTKDRMRITGKAFPCTRYLRNFIGTQQHSLVYILSVKTAFEWQWQSWPHGPQSTNYLLSGPL